jgi:phosphoesterase RecJ-like protein
LKRLARFFEEEDNFLIATHLNPDGDTIGSAIALSLGLDAIGKKNSIFNKDSIPESCEFLPGLHRLIHSIEGDEAGELILVLIDCNSPKRAGLEDYNFRRSVVIDHHETGSDFGDIKWVRPDKPATGLMIFNLLNELGVSITKDIATNLYAAISVDTGTFRFTNTTAETFRVAAELVDAGARAGYISENLYETWMDRKFKLLCLNLKSIDINDSVAITVVSDDMFRTTGTTSKDTENFANFPLLMKRVRISAFFREVKKGIWKVSLRSKGDFNVASIAVMFKGGGHKNAAGCIIEGDIDNAKQILIDAVKSSMQQT